MSEHKALLNVITVADYELLRRAACFDDLLAALKVLVAGDESDRKSGIRLYQNDSPRDKSWRSARAAIAKAEGATS